MANKIPIRAPQEYSAPAYARIFNRITDGISSNSEEIARLKRDLQDKVYRSDAVLKETIQTVRGAKTFTDTPLFQDGIQLQEGTPDTKAGRISLYGDTEDLPKAYVGTAGPVGVPVTWYRKYTSSSFTATTSGNTLMTYSLPADQLAAGQVYRVKAHGGVLNNDVQSSYFWFNFSLGGTTVATAPAPNNVFNCNAADEGYWEVEAYIYVVSISGGTTANLRGTIRATYNEVDTIGEIGFDAASATTGKSVGSTLAIALLDDWSITEGTIDQVIYGGTIEQLY